MEILLLADEADPQACRLAAALGRAKYAVRMVARPGEAEHALRARRLDAVLFDSSVAGSGFLARVRRQHPSQTLVAWTARSSSAGVAELLEAGADEVLHAGMGERELLARVAAALRRVGRIPQGSLELGALRIDPAHGEASWDDRELPLTRREREVLQVLAEAAGRTVRREALYRQVWGYAMARGDRSVDVNVKRLRDKLAATAGGDLAIKTQPGIGYRLELAARVEPTLLVTAL